MSYLIPGETICFNKDNPSMVSICETGQKNLPGSVLILLSFSSVNASDILLRSFDNHFGHKITIVL